MAVAISMVEREKIEKANILSYCLFPFIYYYSFFLGGVGGGLILASAQCRKDDDDIHGDSSCGSAMEGAHLKWRGNSRKSHNLVLCLQNIGLLGTGISG